MRMKAIAAVLASVLVGWAVLEGAPAFGETIPPKPGSLFPHISFPAPVEESVRAYLGLGDGTSFTVDQVDADVVVIEIFSMYCPHCQREAPVVNRFYQVTLQRARPGKKVKIFGVGVGNSQFEVNIFRKKYAIPFPLLPDGDYRIHKLLGQTRTPHFIAVKKEPGGALKVVFSRSGPLGDPEALYNHLVGEP